jgi:hypothetical protein
VDQEAIAIPHWAVVPEKNNMNLHRMSYLGVIRYKGMHVMCSAFEFCENRRREGVIGVNDIAFSYVTAQPYGIWELRTPAVHSVPHHRVKSSPYTGHQGPRGGVEVYLYSFSTSAPEGGG